MKIYILPISGGGFPVQMAFLKILYQATKSEVKIGITPDIVFSSSGGNVSAYIAMMGDWRDNYITKNIHIINSTLFVESWTPPFFPTWLVYPLTKSIYRNGDGVKEVFNRVYTKKSIGKTEIWSGVYNMNSQKSVFFCNRLKNEAQIKCDENDSMLLYDAESPKYLNRDISTIAKVCHASASIPIITEGVIIDGQKYIDGGVGYGSPFVPMKNKLTKVIESNGRGNPIQLFHFSSYDMDRIFSDNFYSKSIGLLIHSMLIMDRDSVVSYLAQHGKVEETPEIYRDLDYIKLRPILEKLKDVSFAMLFSPKTSPIVNLTHFSGNDVIDIIKKVENDFTVFVWKMVYRY